MCVYICMYIYMYVYIYTYIYTHIYTHKHTHTHIYRTFQNVSLPRTTTAKPYGAQKEKKKTCRAPPLQRAIRSAKGKI